MDLTNVYQLASPSLRRWKIPQIELILPHPPHPTLPLGSSQDPSWVPLPKLLRVNADHLHRSCPLLVSSVVHQPLDRLDLGWWPEAAHCIVSTTNTEIIVILLVQKGPSRELWEFYLEHFTWCFSLATSFENMPSGTTSLELSLWLVRQCPSSGFSYVAACFLNLQLPPSNIFLCYFYFSKKHTIHKVSTKWYPGSSEHKRNAKHNWCLGRSQAQNGNSKGT